MINKGAVVNLARALVEPINILADRGRYRSLLGAAFRRVRPPAVYESKRGI